METAKSINFSFQSCSTIIDLAAGEVGTGGGPPIWARSGQTVDDFFVRGRERRRVG